MPDTPAPAAAAHKGIDSLGKKVGPFPIFVWGILGVGAYYLYTKYAGSTPSQNDVAGGTGVDGEDIGSNEIIEARYKDNADWAAQAINYLAGIGVPRGQATTEIHNYLRGLPNTAQGRADVQLALNALGPPPVNAPDAAGGGGGGGGEPPPGPNPPTRHMVTVPGVVGKQVHVARDVIDRAGLKSTINRSDTGHAYHVVSQSPKGGTKVKKGSTVHLTIKRGKGS